MFKPGDIIVAIRSHNQGRFKKGDIFEVKHVTHCPCACHKFLVHIGDLSTKVKNVQVCQGCKKKFTASSNRIYFSNYYFVIAQFGYADLLEKKLKEEEVGEKEVQQLQLELDIKN